MLSFTESDVSLPDASVSCLNESMGHSSTTSGDTGTISLYSSKPEIRCVGASTWGVLYQEQKFHCELQPRL